MTRLSRSAQSRSDTFAKLVPTFTSLAKRALASCLLAVGTVLLLSPCDADAKPREFGPQEKRFIVDIPDGWQQKKVDDSIQLVSADGRTVMSLRWFAREKRTPESLARKAARDLNVTDIQQVGDHTWIFFVVSEDVRIHNTMNIFDDYVVLATTAGDIHAAEPVLSSLKTKPE